MRVNNDLSTTFSKMVAGTEIELQMKALAEQAKSNVTAAQTEVITTKIAQLENQLFQMFFEQGPQVGQALKHLHTLQTQNLPKAATAATADPLIQENIAKLLDTLTALVIKPQTSTIETGLKQIQKSMLTFFDELARIQQQASPELRAKLDKFITQLFVEFPELSDLAFLAKTGLAKNPISGQNPQLEQAPENALKQGEKGNATAAQIKTGSGNADATQQAKAGSGHTDEAQQTTSDLSNTAAKSQELVPKKFMPAMEPTGVQQTTVTEEEVVTNLPVKPSPDSDTAAFKPLIAGQKQALSASTTESIILSQTEQTEFAALKQPLPSLTVIQQKMDQVVNRLSGEFAEKLPAEVIKLLNNLTSDFKSLHVNLETQWENILRYPVIYKQVLQKTIKLLQEFLRSEQATNPVLHQSLTDLLAEITANLHVQRSFNQIDQENPAKQQQYFQIPLQMDKEIKTGEMLVTHEREKRGNKWHNTSSWYRFYLETQFIGPVDVSLQAQQKQLTIKLTVTTEHQAVIFNQNKDILRKILTDNGYDVLDIACGAGTVSPIYLALKELIQQQGVDVRI